MNKENLKYLLTLIGKFLGLAGLAYVLYTLSQTYTWESFLDKFTQISSLIPLLILLNILSILLGILAWHTILQQYAQDRFRFALSYYYFAKTEIAKYLPGNIFHLIGRQTIAKHLNISQAEMAKTSFLFTLLILVGTLYAATLFSFSSTSVPFYIIGMLLMLSLATYFVVKKIYPSFLSSIKYKISLYLTFSVALQGIMLSSVILYQASTLQWSHFGLLAGIYILSWLIGFITPGASGGLGVREGAFIAIMTYLDIAISSDIVLFSVLLVRLINILIDILLYISTFMLKSKLPITDIS